MAILHWKQGLLCDKTSVDTTDSGERGMNPVAMTITNPRKEYWPNWGSNQCPPVLLSCTLPTIRFGQSIESINQFINDRSIDQSMNKSTNYLVD